MERKFLSPVEPENGSFPMSQVDPWEKAAECALAAEAASDPERQAILVHLQYLWITLGTERGFLSVEELARETETISRLHAEVLTAPRRTVH
jgi:hypothetical protein